MASRGGWRRQNHTHFGKRLCLPGVAVQTGACPRAVPAMVRFSNKGSPRRSRASSGRLRSFHLQCPASISGFEEGGRRATGAYLGGEASKRVLGATCRGVVPIGKGGDHDASFRCQCCGCQQFLTVHVDAHGVPAAGQSVAEVEHQRSLQGTARADLRVRRDSFPSNPQDDRKQWSWDNEHGGGSGWNTGEPWGSGWFVAWIAEASPNGPYKYAVQAVTAV